MNVTAHRPNEPLCLPAARKPSWPVLVFFSLFCGGRGADYLGTWAHWQKHTTCASAFTHASSSHIYSCVKKKHPRHTNWLMSRSISCCMKLKMASGRRSIVYLLRGHASAFLCHSKKKNILQCSFQLSQVNTDGLHK